MNATVNLNGVDFEVTVNEDKNVFGRYTLRKIGGHGLTYTTTRNAHKPHLMSLTNPNRRGLSQATGLWVSDENGTLRQVGG